MEWPIILAMHKALVLGALFVLVIETLFIDALVHLFIDQTKSKRVGILFSIKQDFPLALTLIVIVVEAHGFLLHNRTS
jgi:hypothetical protein